MGNQLFDICSNGRADSDSQGKTTSELKGKGSHVLDSQNVTSDIQQLLGRSSPSKARSRSSKRLQAQNRSSWSSREEKMLLLAGKLVQSDHAKSQKVKQINTILSRANNLTYCSPERRLRSSSLTNAQLSSHHKSWSKTKSLEQSLCNPHSSSAEIMKRFEFLSVEERKFSRGTYS
jgi:hypothetical protein